MLQITLCVVDIFNIYINIYRYKQLVCIILRIQQISYMTKKYDNNKWILVFFIYERSDSDADDGVVASRKFDAAHGYNIQLLELNLTNTERL